MSVIIVALSGFLFIATKVFAQTSGRDFVAGFTQADLASMPYVRPGLFWTLLAVVIAFCVGYCIYYFAKAKKK